MIGRRGLIALALVASLGLAAASGARSASPEPESPKLQALARALDAGDTLALPAFWQELARTHAPLIEEIPGRPQDVLYTFVWHAEPGQVALNVLFNGWFPLHQPTGFDSFTRLRDSDLWYTSYTLTRAAHLRYELIAPKGWHASPDRVSYFTMDEREYETFHDPLNPRLMDWNDSVVSYTQGPDAATSAYLVKRADTASGTLETLPIDSKILGNSRTLRIYLPAGYQRNARAYGLLLAYDGNQYTQGVPTPTILDNMIAARVIPAVVAVFVESPDRDREFPPNDSFQRFVAEELVPQLRAHYHLSRDPRQSAVLGSSYGGLAATYTALTHPELFGNVISQSGSYAWSPPAPGQPSTPRALGTESMWLIKRVAETRHENIRFSLDVGVWEGSGMLLANRVMRSVLLGKGYDVAYLEADGTHSSFYWMLRLPQALQAILGSGQKRVEAYCADARSSHPFGQVNDLKNCH
ncbi:MAG TPA: alpha/beta hydrolase-fold protein [Steroidobacteraceae bacterium]|nr:alpha/beta hydrolase-fold protein [Steroidobacteraceae bacterium]